MGIPIVILTRELAIHLVLFVQDLMLTIACHAETTRIFSMTQKVLVGIVNVILTMQVRHEKSTKDHAIDIVSHDGGLNKTNV